MKRLAAWLSRWLSDDGARRAVEETLADERHEARTSGAVLARVRMLAAFVRIFVLHDFRAARLTSVRFALRHWRSRPLVAVLVVAMLGLGLGVTAAAFSAIDAGLLQPLPWPDPGRLVTMWVVRPAWRTNPVFQQSWDRGLISWPMFKKLQGETSAFDDVAAWNSNRLVLDSETNEIVQTLQVSASFLAVLGVAIERGRLFTPDEDETPTQAVLISYESWRNRFGGAEDILGRTLSINSRRHQVVGVLRPGFRFPWGDPPEFLMPLGIVAPASRAVENHFLNGLARLKSGASLDAAAREAELVFQSFTQEPRSARISTLGDEQLGPSRRPLLLLLSAALLLLLVASCNAAGLLFSDAHGRRHEAAIRAALGGSRPRLLGQLAVEGSVLAIGAAVVGVVIAIWLTPWLADRAPTHLPRLDTVAVSGRTMIATALTAVLVVALASLGPAWVLTRAGVAQAIQQGGRDAGLRRLRGHRAIVAAQIALAAMLFVAASLLQETVMRMTRQPLGFNPDPLAVGVIRPPRLAPQDRYALGDRIVARLRSIPGVEDAAAGLTAPFWAGGNTNVIKIPGKTFDREISARRHIVSDGYFHTVGLSIRKGRGFDASDRLGTFVAVVSAEFERRLLDGDAIGKTFVLFDHPFRVIGVADEAKQREYTDDPVPAYYALARQLPDWSMNAFIVRASVPPVTVLSSMRRAIVEVEPSLVVTETSTVSSLIDRSIAEERYRALLASLLSVSALLLAGIGVFGLVSRSVADRRREIGVRAALGAAPVRLRRLVMGQATGLAIVGVAIGLPAAMVTSRVLSSVLYGVTPTSVHIAALTVVVFCAMAALAALAPAWRAGRINAVEALRSE